eukprot:5263320-Karenia_brevis.AAC.1
MTGPFNTTSSGSGRVKNRPSARRTRIAFASAVKPKHMRIIVSLHGCTPPAGPRLTASPHATVRWDCPCRVSHELVKIGAFAQIQRQAHINILDARASVRNSMDRHM